MVQKYRIPQLLNNAKLFILDIKKKSFYNNFTHAKACKIMSNYQCTKA